MTACRSTKPLTNTLTTKDSTITAINVEVVTTVVDTLARDTTDFIPLPALLAQVRDSAVVTVVRVGAAILEVTSIAGVLSVRAVSDRIIAKKTIETRSTSNSVFTNTTTTATTPVTLVTKPGLFAILKEVQWIIWLIIILLLIFGLIKYFR